MDSGTSGSMQSSSGGDEEYDSRAADSISALLSSNNPQSHVVHNMANHHHAPPHHQSSSTMFDPLSNFFDPAVSSRPLSQLGNPNSLLNLDMVWPKPIRSDPNSSDLGGLMPSSSSTQNQAQLNFLTNNIQLGGHARGVGGIGSAFPAIQIPPENAPRGSPVVVSGGVGGGSSAPNDRNDANSNVVRNPKKRSRASRRAPTTVLTTDTTNFRAMVQEFTGIPAPPFTSSAFPRTRLDLFGSGSSLRSGPLDPSPPYLLRPFAQKVQAQQPPAAAAPFVPPPNTTTSSSSPSSSFPSSTTMVEALVPNSTTSIASTSTSISYHHQLSSDHLGLLKQQNQSTLLNNMSMQQNPVLNFHSLLQTQPKFALSKPQGPLMEIPHQNDPHLKMGHHHVLEEFGLSQAHQLGGLPNLMSSSSDGGALPRNDGNPPPPPTTTTTTTTTANWCSDGMGSNDNGRSSGNDNNNVDQTLLRSINGGYGGGTGAGSERQLSNGKLNFSASSSDFHGSKGPENVTRTEGMVESWICSSD